MTTSPVLSITAELLAELEDVAERLDVDLFDERGASQVRVAADTIRSLTERLENETKRVDYMVRTSAVIHEFPGTDSTRFAVVWPYDDEQQSEIFKSPREAIDAAIAQEGQSHE